MQPGTESTQKLLKTCRCIIQTNLCIQYFLFDLQDHPMYFFLQMQVLTCLCSVWKVLSKAAWILCRTILREKFLGVDRTIRTSSEDPHCWAQSVLKWILLPHKNRWKMLSQHSRKCTNSILQLCRLKKIIYGTCC